MSKNKTLLFLLIIPILFVSVWFRHGNLLGTGEGGLPFYNIQRFNNLQSFAWTDASLGNSLGIGFASTPTYQFLAVFQKMGIPGYLLEQFFFTLMFIISGMAIYFLAKEIFPELGDRYLILAVLFYWFNPFSLVNVWNRFLYNYFVFWALLPLALFLFLKGIIKIDYKWAILTSLSTVFFSYALTSPAFNLLLWISLFIVFVFYFLSVEKQRFFFVRYFLVFAISFVLFNFWWISQLVPLVTSGSYSVAVSEFFNTKGNLSSLSSISSLLGKFINTFRLEHGTFFTSGPVWAKIYNYFPFSVLTYLPFGLVFLGILKFKKDQRVIFLSLFMLVSLYLAKGNEAPFGNIFEFIFSRSTLFQLFRNPFEKFGFLLPIPLSLLFAYIFFKFSKKIFTLAAFIFILGFWAFPFWTGLIFTDGSSLTNLKNIEVKVPNYYKEANEWLKNIDGQFRFVSFPLDGEGMTYTWSRPYSGVELSTLLFDIPNLSFNTTIPYYDNVVRAITKSINNTDDLIAEASLTNSKFIIVRKDVDWKGRGLKNPDEIEKLLENNKNFIKVKVFEKLSIFQIDDSLFKPKIYVSESSLKVEPYPSIEDIRLVSDIGIDTLYSSKNQLSNTKEILVKPGAMNLVKKNKQFTIDDALSSLLYAKYLPDTPLYKIIQVKEWIERRGISDPNQLYIFDLTKLGKRLVEAYGLVKNEFPNVIYEATINSYFKTLDEIIGNYPDLMNDSPTNPYKDLTINELFKHTIIFKEIKNNFPIKYSVTASNALDKLNNQLVNLGFKAKFDIILESNKLSNNYVTYRFDVKEDGDYSILLENNRWNEFYSNGLKSIDLQIDHKIYRFTPLINKTLTNFINIGNTLITKGNHEISFTEPNEKNLISDTDGFEVNSDNLPEVFYNVNPYDPAVTYKIQFDYWIKKGNSIDLVAIYNNDSQDQHGEVPGFKRSFTTNNYDNDFRSETVYVVPRDGSSSMQIGFSVKPFNDCSKRKSPFKSCDDKSYNDTFNKPTFVEIKNISVTKIFNNKIYLVKYITPKIENLPKIKFIKLNPTNYKITVRDSTNPYTLVFSELYNMGWDLTFASGKTISSDKHFLINSFANAWQIDQKGSYELNLKFLSQSIFILSAKISVFSFIVFVIWLFYLTWKKKNLK